MKIRTIFIILERNLLFIFCNELGFRVPTEMVDCTPDGYMYHKGNMYPLLRSYGLIWTVNMSIDLYSVHQTLSHLPRVGLSTDSDGTWHDALFIRSLWGELKSKEYSYTDLSLIRSLCGEFHSKEYVIYYTLIWLTNIAVYIAVYCNICCASVL